MIEMKYIPNESKKAIKLQEDYLNKLYDKRIQKKILLRLDEELYKALKHAAVDRLITVNGLLIEIIKKNIVKKEIQ